MYINQRKPFYKRKPFLITLSVLIVLGIAIRLVIEPIVHKKLNAYLEKFSPTLAFHVDDLDFAILRGAYTFEGITGRMKGNKNQFVKIDEVDVSMSWASLFRGMVVTEIEVIGMNFSYSDALKEAATKGIKKDAQ